MHFTLVFDSNECHDLSFSLVFTAAPVWKSGRQTIVNLTKEGLAGPYLQAGGLKLLLDKGEVLKKLAKDRKNVVLVIHPEGHGCEKSLTIIRQELSDEGFSIKEINFSDFE
tara:strand:- start:198 stop:530 length:333 start_codon:yes stop_codon:yes gene_type:complete